MRVVLASANPAKVVEMAEILRAIDPDIELVGRPPEVPEVVEDADTLEGNARLKADALCEATGAPAIADDTGLEVDALSGAPGVRSARFAGEGADDAANVARLLAELAARGADEPATRRARFRTVVVLREPDGAATIAEGAVEGHIALAPRGGGGFGYDPVFVADDVAPRTFAELSPEEKHAISHRGRALRALARELGDRRPGA